MNNENVLQELEDRFRVDPLAIYSKAADLIALQQQVCDKLFRSLTGLFQKTELLLSPSDAMIIKESLTAYEMINTFFGEQND